MRLIDADKLIERIEEIARTDMMKVLVESWIKEQPTAFDVEKVVVQLEDYKMWRELLIYDLNFRERQIIKKAIEIVKRGGIDE